MARRKIVNLNLDPELLERLDQLVELRRSAGQETNRSKLANDLLTTALQIVNLNLDPEFLRELLTTAHRFEEVR